jgi:hypothetical protein
MSSSENWEEWECSAVVHRLCIDSTQAYDSDRLEVMYNILTKSDIPWN